MTAETTRAPLQVDPTHWRAFVDLVRGGRVCVISGAGLSTESGIPAYRGPDGERRVTPMTVSELLASPGARQRYWARAYVGWPRFAAAQPNAGHRAVARLERAGVIDAVITQNVDGLHQEAGSRRVTELHGSLDRVVCVDCGEKYARQVVDQWLAEANPDFARVDVVGQVRPDGDVVLSGRTGRAISPRGVRGVPLRPSQTGRRDVWGVGRKTLGAAVLRHRGSVISGPGAGLVTHGDVGVSVHRFAAREGIPVAVVTQGLTRAEAEASIKINAPLGPTLTALAEAL